MVSSDQSTKGRHTISVLALVYSDMLRDEISLENKAGSDTSNPLSSYY